MFASVGNPERAESSLSAIAENFNILKKPSAFARFGSEKLPHEFGRKDKFVYFIAVISGSNQPVKLPNDVFLDEIINSLLRKNSAQKCLLPYPVISRLKDVSLYLEEMISPSG